MALALCLAVLGAGGAMLAALVLIHIASQNALSGRNDADV